MDPIDELAQALAGGMSRRQALRRFAGGLTAALVATIVPWREPTVTYARNAYDSVRQISGISIPGGRLPGILVSSVPASSGSPGSALSPFVGLGANGPDVEAIQYLLRQHGADIEPDGDFGGQTDGAVRAFQRANGLLVDGIVGPKTWDVLIVTVHEGDQGDAVSGAQTLLNWHDAGIEVDGDFGDQTTGAVRDFQTANGLTVDGVVGPQTWTALIRH